jgi:glycosidase
MGIDIIWLMPIHPIGAEKRKGTLGSEYSVKDYYGVNPEYGNMNDFKSLVDKIHSMGMYVILDWVANHSAWDNPLAKEHPDWYTKTKDGQFQPTPWYDWSDVIDFDYNNPEMRKYMTDAMKYWVKEGNVDGYRCDVGGFIPLDFWENVRSELDEIKPVFMLAEWESRDLHKKAFDMTYSWTLFKELEKASEGRGNLGGLIEYMAHDVNYFPKNGYRMTFTDNHDMNSWYNTPFINFGEGLKAAMVFTCTVNGMPLVYSGQEAGLNKSLKFFDKDEIDWKDHEFYGLFQQLFELKHNNQALWNGSWGGEMIRIDNDKPQEVVSFIREKNQQAVLSIINFSPKTQQVKLQNKHYSGRYTELFSKKTYNLKGEDVLSLAPWSYLVLYK